MNNKHCETMLDEYLMLDKGQHVPFKLTRHMLTCKECRRKIKMLSYAERCIAKPLSVDSPVTDEAIRKAMENIDGSLYKKASAKPLPLAGWIIGGFIMTALLFVSLVQVPGLANRSLSISYGLLIGGSVTIYCACFVMSNIDVFVKKISTHLHREWIVPQA